MQRMTHTIKRTIAIFFGVCLALCMGGLSAQAKQSKRKTTKKAAKKVLKKARKAKKVQRAIRRVKTVKTTHNWRQLKRKARKKGRKVMRAGLTKLKGKRHKPEAVYFLYRSKSGYKNKQLQRKSLLGKVIGSVKRNPF